jgi:hypothetical protein
MRASGFDLGPDGFWFYRWRGDFLDVIQFWRVSNGNAFRVPISTWIKGMDDSGYDFANFPKGFIKDRENPSGKQLGKEGVSNTYYDWWTTDEEKTLESLNGILAGVSAFAVPWFDSIVDKKSLFESLPFRLREGQFGEHWRSKIFG